MRFEILGIALALVASGMATTSCKTASSGVDSGRSDLESLAADEGPGTLNQVIAFGSPGSGEDFLPAVKVDIENIAAPFSNPRVGFQVRTFIDELDYDTIIAQTEKYAHDVATDGTLVWVFSGHGYDAGEMMVDRDVLKFSHIAKAILRARADRPLKRLVVIVDACYSGNLIEGGKPVSGFKLSDDGVSMSQALLDEAVKEFSPLTGEGGSDGLSLTTKVFDEVVVLTSSRMTEKSNSDKTKGSQMLRALNMALAEVASPASHYSIDGFLDRVAVMTKQLNAELNENGKPLVPQTPLYQVLPSGVGSQEFASKRSTP